MLNRPQLNRYTYRKSPILAAKLDAEHQVDILRALLDLAQQKKISKFEFSIDDTTGLFTFKYTLKNETASNAVVPGTYLIVYRDGSIELGDESMMDQYLSWKNTEYLLLDVGMVDVSKLPA